MVDYWEIATRSVSNLFSLYFVYFKYLFISRFGFKSGVCLLIAAVLVHCFSITFVSSKMYGKRHNFNFDVVDFPILDDEVPRRSAYGVYILQLIRFARGCSHGAVLKF